MIELTEGELRFIEESVNNWWSLVYDIMDYMDEVPKEVGANVRSLREQYKAEFGKFYAAEKEKNSDLIGGDVQAAFDADWEKAHPEYYDVKTLFAACDASELEKAAPAIRKAEEFFGVE